MSGPTAPPSWYFDPSGNGQLRWWNGQTWTEHVAPQPFPTPMWLPWKGYQIGCPAEGPGSLASPGKRVAAFLIDFIFLLVVFALVLTTVLLIAAPHFGPIFPKIPVNDPNAEAPFPGLFWIYFSVLGSALAACFLMVVYQVVATAVYGRSLGKKLLHIRPVRASDLQGLGWGEALGSSAVFWGAIAVVNWLGLLVPIWCLWDDKRQGLHDKAVDSVVIEDLPG